MSKTYITRIVVPGNVITDRYYLTVEVTGACITALSFLEPVTQREKCCRFLDCQGGQRLSIIGENIFKFIRREKQDIIMISRKE
jgi:hypothetical protein